MDFLDDPFSEPTVVKAPTTGRFQPKVKPRPKKGPSTAAVKATKKPPVTSVLQNSVLNQLVQPNVLVEKKSDAPNISSLTDAENLENPLIDGNLSAEAREVAVSAVTEHSTMAVSNSVGDRHLSADSSLGLQLPPNIIGISTTAACWSTGAETPPPDASSIQNEAELPVFPNVSFTGASPLRPCNSQIAHEQSIDMTFQDSELLNESIVCNEGDFQIDVDQLEAGDFSCLDNVDLISESAAASEKRAVKFQPKPKAQSERLRDPAEAVHNPHGSRLSSENPDTTCDGSIHAGEPDSISDRSHMRLDGKFSIDSSVYQPDFVGSEDTEPLIPADSQQDGEYHGEKMSYDALDSSVKPVDEVFLSGVGVNDNGYEFLDEMIGEFQDKSNSHNGAPDDTTSNRDANNDDDHLKEETSQKKRSRKSKEAACENDKPAKRRRKATQESDDTTEKPPKKFPRATRRKRCVDKSLLEAPEDELDLQRVPIRDLILLAEYKERQAKKEGATVLPASTSERTGNTSTEDPPYDDEGFGVDKDGDHFNNPSTSEVLTDTGYFNYQSFMQKEPRARWTKQDTELFYQGIRQFGSDLSMIQQLFPGRTRHQIKLKYKKEERQNPMSLHDALTSRAQDLSHFEIVIQRLQEQAAQEAKTDNDDSVCQIGEDEGLDEVLNTHEEVAKSDQKEECRVAEQDSDKHQVESPPKSYYSEEEEFDWSEYKSDL